MKMNEKSTIYWTFNDIEDDFNIESKKKNYDNDLNWYNADDDEFINAQEMIDDFHIKYSRKAH